MTHHAVGRLYVKSFANLPHGRTEPAALDSVADEVINFALALRQLTEVRHTNLLSKPPGGNSSINGISKRHNLLPDRPYVNLSILDFRSQHKTILVLISDI